MDVTYLVGGAAVSWLAVGFAIVQLGLKLAVPPSPHPHCPARTFCVHTAVPPSPQPAPPSPYSHSPHALPRPTPHRPAYSAPICTALTAPAAIVQLGLKLAVHLVVGLGIGCT